MRNFQGIVFIWLQTYREDFQICISVPLNEDLKLLTLFLAGFWCTWEWTIFARDFAIRIIIFYDFSSFQSVDFGDVTRKTSENRVLLKTKISDEQKIGRDLTEPSWERPETVLYVFNMLI